MIQKLIILWYKITGIQELRNRLLTMESRFNKLSKEVEDRINHFTEFTRADADIGFRGNNTIILTGVFKNKGYVEFYDLNNREFEDMVGRMKSMRKDNLIRNIDSLYPGRCFFNIK